ncbi:hypothetical protein LPJ61_001727 [Coemansia biformis]|uniref:Multiple inositol polyphosphate phosphatase 1 n=1 Tax=Coemansia biformis TaxID=1286918 RepID=A0A9W7YG50_9FUNG|nr:hypothetical protein LPJ61_001727 [Coemansia biformis]
MSTQVVPLVGNGTPEGGHGRPARRRLACIGGCLLLACGLYVYLRSDRGDSADGLPLPLSAKSPYPPVPAGNYTAPDGMGLVQVQFILRHGARYPAAGEMNSFERLYSKLRRHVPPSWLDPDLITGDKAWDLSESGRQETARIARRIVGRYPALLSSGGPGMRSLRFVSSDFARTVATAAVFRATVDADNETPPVATIPRANDTILAIKYTCPRWAVARLQEKANLPEEYAVFDAMHGKDLRDRVSRRLGIDADMITVNDVHKMYALCGYNMALYGKDTHWCTLLDRQTTELMELRNDIEYTRIYGRYGGELNRHVACSLATSVFQDIDSALRDPAAATSVFRFGHAETLLFLTTLLGADRALGAVDPPITGGMGAKDSKRRGFKSSVLIPFSSNWGLELYRDQHAQAYFRLLLNERPVRLPGCDDVLCPLPVLRGMLGADLGCNYAELCKTSE